MKQHFCHSRSYAPLVLKTLCKLERNRTMDPAIIEAVGTVTLT